MSLNSARSANSRRSRNSNISNQSSKSNSNNSNKKQKTLGAAWGANSLASSRSSFRKAPFSDFGSYMVVKNDKLRDQFDAEALSSSQGGSSSTRPIFQGVSIFVDGFTIPSSQELRAYMLKHGGHFENYFSRHRVTHIICSHLPDSKIKNLRSFSRGLPVVKPTWVLDSVAARKLLSWVPYQLDQLNEACNQPKLFAFFSSKINCASDEGGSTVPSSRGSDRGASTVPFSPLKADSLDSESGSVVKDTFPLEVGELSKCARQCGGENDSFSHRGKGVRKAEETTCNKGHLETEVDEPRSANSENLPFEEKRQFNPLCPSASASASHLEEASTSLSGGHSYRHSTIGDPNFVENYFKSSRLHFIGTWRNRYRKRFFSQSSGSKHNSLVINASEISGDTTIIHIDMDCFFVSVIVRNRPELRDKPVAVCHSDSQKGTAEISSANYPARDYGVKAGMFVRDAKSLCPHLLIVPYNFEAYEEVADQFYNILHKHCNRVQAVSCDEAFLDVTHSEEKDPELLASVIRKEIFEATGCTASAGISGNLLMARLATRSAKPDGQYYINPEKVDEYLLELPIKALPGIGNVLDKKLRKIGVQTCGQLRMIPKECLQKDFGEKTGEMLWSYSRGVDNRPVGAFQESKSVGAEVNWGVRFNDLKDPMQGGILTFAGMWSRGAYFYTEGVVLVMNHRGDIWEGIKKRRKGAEEPSKYMGCGDCENLSHSTTVTVATDDVDVLQRITLQLFGYFSIDVKDIRGVGLQVSKLENADYAKQDKNTLRSWLTSASGSIEQSHKPLTTSTNDGTTGGKLCASSGGLSSQNAVDPLHQRSSSSHDSALPSLHDLDIGILKSLPSDLFLEINEVYGGKLINFISRGKGKIDDIAGSVNTSVVGQDIQKEETCKQEIYKAGSSNNGKIQALSASAARSASGINPGGEFQNPDLMPSSLSQIDISVFDQLPAELRADIVGKLPTHRKEDCPSDPVNVTAETIGLQGNNSRFIEPASNKNLCEGSPPCWVDKFKKSNCLVLNVLAEMYSTTGCVGKLSSLLQQSISQIQLLDASDDGMPEAISTLCELVKQYIKLKLETDLEELYICFRLLKRLAMKSEVFREVYGDAFPFLQLSVGESYGGFLHFSSPK